MYDLFEIGKKQKNAPALIADTGVQVTYGELENQMAAFEKLFAKRSLVFCMCKNEPGAVVGYLGTMAADSVPLLLAADLKEAQFSAFFENYHPAYIWASFVWMEEHRAVLQSLIHEKNVETGNSADQNRAARQSLMYERNIETGNSADQNRLVRQSLMYERNVETGNSADKSRVVLQNSTYERNLQISEPGSFLCPLFQAYGYGLWATGNMPYELHPDLGLLLATSGSTGDPKLVRLSHRNLLANAKSICEYLQLDADERPITTLPMQYTYGLSIINSHLFTGAAILMTTAGYVQSAFWEFFEQQGATSFGGVPYTYEILKKIHLFQKKLPSLRSITQAGGKLSVSLQKEVAEWALAQGVRFFVMYGQTEATARMGYLPPEMCLKKLGSMGIAIPGGRFFLADEKGREISAAKSFDIGEVKSLNGFGEKDDFENLGSITDQSQELNESWEKGGLENSRLSCPPCRELNEAGEKDDFEIKPYVEEKTDAVQRLEDESDSDGYSGIGELVYVGENVSLGYASCARDLRLGDERGGVLFTGDLARRDADGYYYIVGRKKRFVKIFGVRVSLDACEETLRGWYPGAEIACAGHDECLNIYIVDGSGRVFPQEEHIQERMAEYLQLNRKAFHIFFLDRMLKNDAGKILYKELAGAVSF